MHDNYCLVCEINLVILFSMVCTVLRVCVCIYIYRKMMGVDLQGLSIEELQQLEAKLEAGLTRVIQTKVCFNYNFN